MAELSWPKIKELRDYRVNPEESFWENFPKRDLPLAPSTAVNKAALRKMLKDCKSKITSHQWRRGVKCLQDLAEGANAAQKKRAATNNSKECGVSIRKREVVDGQDSNLGRVRVCSRPIQDQPSAQLQG
jgi:hypothetical protein